MLSYKKWKKINENFGVNLGVKTPNKINSLHSKWDETGMSMPSMPMKSKKSKKMFGGDDGPDMGSGPGDSLGGGDDLGGGPPMAKHKSKGKKPPFPPHHGDDDDDDSLGGLGGDDLDADMDGDDAGPGDHDDDDAPDLGGDDDGPDLGDHDDDDDDGGDSPFGGGDDDDTPGVGGPDGGPTGGMGDTPAKSKKKGGSFIDKTKAVADGAKLMHKGASKMIKGMKEGAECAKCKTMCKDDSKDGDDESIDVDNGKMWSKKSKKSRKMTKEEAEFFRSLQSQTGCVKFAKDDTGAWAPVSEDAVIPPSNPNANITDDDEPEAGDVGYAPQGRVGGGLGSFTEWASKYQRRSKK